MIPLKRTETNLMHSKREATWTLVYLLSTRQTERLWGLVPKETKPNAKNQAPSLILIAYQNQAPKLPQKDPLPPKKAKKTTTFYK